MKRAVMAVLMVLAACGDETAVPTPPPPRPLTAEAVGHYCGMVVEEHAGPKAQVLVKGRDQPYWFTSVRDAKAFTLLPEEPKDILAVYVTDMARAGSWENRTPSWMPAAEAVYVIGSSQMGGMGHPEAVPFSSVDAAKAFALDHGGRIVDWASIPEGYVLGGRR